MVIKWSKAFASRCLPKQQLKKLIIPLIIEQILVIGVGMIDTIMIASAGEAAVSGVSLVDMVNVLIINVFAALATGGAVVASQLIGARRQEEACEAARQIVAVSLAISLIVMAAALCLRAPILRLLFGAIEDEVMEHAMTYFLWSLLSYPFLAVYNAGAALFRSIGNSKVAMYTSLAMNGINVVGNALFLYVFHMGVMGVALATLIARAVAMAVVLVLLGDRRGEIFIDYRRRFHFEWEMIRRILHIGIPSGLENSFFQLGRVLVVSVISLFSTVQIAANAVANNLDALGCIPGSAMNLAVITVVGQCVGAGDYAQARGYIKKLMKITYIITIALNAAILLTLPLTLRIYNLSPETTELAAALVLIHDGCAMLLWPLSFTLPNALRAANDVRYTMIVSIASMCIFRLLFSYILGIQLQMGAIGVWIAMILDWICRVICFVWRYRSGKWEEHKIG